MGTVLEYLFSPPAFPESLLTSAAGNLASLLKESFRLAYYRGVYDGFVAGAIVCLIFLPRRSG